MTWWIAHAERALSQDVPAPPERVRDFYVDLDNLKLVHPLIVAVQALSRTETRDGYRQSYRVIDRIPMGPLNLEVRYRARLHVPVHGAVHTEADQFPRVRLRATVTFAPVAAGTRLTERIAMAAPRPLASYTTRAAVQAHAAMLAGIRSYFESS
ncbi:MULTISPECIES: SRPBCC family protein [Mycobacterium]|uniref:Polyketide cyclase / dehydrase and lipid transport n=1 Tax=Mycobacterium pseudoshottsii TaxID=265949 RepID=A0A9N7QM35_9MYCO|nr:MULTISPECIES: SRPBCC family protein [Mycobacterium]EPQ44557.1 hypothetical protein MMSP_0317 [Mycobacterium sp. 012931]MBC9864057.1 hypothetical protein [Mycobacterium pseudoshottsii]RFZ61852.1 Polyketide cyclase / dehydrase and lipid transport [Mycobacterium marinum]BBA86125.1 hypothetical protein MPSD_03890 [Mycobacterium pseudoshottsii JCM 15466]BDN80170.1 hypothetical protein NJB1907Z4_C03850 [Mycobacterium pseudoshottsii]